MKPLIADGGTPAIEKEDVRFPLEIPEYILSFLDTTDDISCIAACALVCRAWFPFSRKKLFHSIRIDRLVRWIAFEDTVLSSSLPGTIRALELARELHVKSLLGFRIKVDEGDEDTRHAKECAELQTSPWAHLTLVQCAPRMTGLRQLTMDQIQWEPTDPLSLTCGNSYRSLTRLDIRGSTFSDFVQLHQFVTSFPALLDLGISELNVRSRAIPSHLPPGGHALRSLSLLDCYGRILPTLVRCLADAGLVRSLTALRWMHEAATSDTGNAWNLLASVIEPMSVRVLAYDVPFTRQGV